MDKITAYHHSSPEADGSKVGLLEHPEQCDVTRLTFMDRFGVENGTCEL